MLEGELSPAGRTAQIGLVLYPLVEALFMELMLAVQLSDHRLFGEVLQAETAVIVLVLIFWLVLDIPKELPLN